MKKAVFIFSLLALTVTILFSQQNDFPKLTGPYLEQKPPGKTPEIFAPGIVTTKEDEYAFEISPSGDEMLFVRSKWMEPSLLKTIIPSKQLHAPSIAGNGNLYEDGIIRFKYLNGKYLPEEKIESLRGFSPFISPDESYMIFGARLPGKRDSDLFISFRDPEGTWCRRILLGNEINSLANEGNSFVTADGNYLFFSRKMDIYWVEAKIIEELRPKNVIKKEE